MPEIRQGVTMTADTSNLEAGLDRVKEKSKQTGKEVEAAGKKGAAGVSEVEKGLVSLERQIIRMAGAWFLYKGALAGLKGSDEIDTLTKQIDNLTNSVGGGAQALAFFESVQTRTRATSVELLKVYEALAGSNLGKGGFKSQQDLQKFSVELANAGTAAGITTPKMLAFWEAVRRGEGARFDKDTMSKLGINNATAKDLDAVIKKIEELSEKGEKMGLTFEIALNKIGASWAIAFGKGAAEGKQDAYSNLVEKLTDPKILKAVAQIGEAVITTLRALGGFVQAVSGIFQSVFGLLVGAVSTVTKFISERLADVFQALADATNGTMFGKLKSWFQDRATQSKNDSISQNVMKQYGFDTMLAGLGDIKSAFDDSTGAANRFTGSLKTNATGQETNKDKTLENEKAQRKLRAALAEVENANDAVAAVVNRIHSAFDVEAGESPLEAKLRSMDKQYKDIDLTLDKVIEKQQRYLDHPAGVDKVVLDAAPGIIAAAQAAKNLNDAMHGSAEAARNYDYAHQQVEKLESALKKANDAIRDMNNNVKDAMSQFTIFDRDSSITQLPAIVAGIEKAMQEALMKAQQTGISAGKPQEEINRDLDIIAARYKDIEQQFTKDTVEAAKKWAEGFTKPMTDIFTDLAMTGGKNFGEIGGAMFNQAVRNGMSKLSVYMGDAVKKGFSLDIVPESQYNPADNGGQSYADYKTAQTDKQEAVMQAVGAAIGGISQVLTMFQNASKGQQTNVAMSTISMAAVGASIGTAIAPGLGTIIGAVVGALVGGIMAAIANSKALKELPFANYGIRNGEIYMEAARGHEENFKKITAKDLNDMLTQMQTVMDAAKTSYIKLLLKLPHDVYTIFSVDGFNFSATAKDWDNQLDVLREFSSDFNLWVENLLPKAVAEHFRDEVGRGFGALGMTAEGFTHFWDAVQNLDPKLAAQVLNDVADALTNFGNALTYGNAITGNFQGAFGTNEHIFGARGGTTDGMTEWDQQMDAFKQKFSDLAIEVQTLPFEDAAHAAAELGAGMAELQANLTTFLNDLLDKSKAISQKIADEKYNIRLSGAKTDAEKSGIMMDRYKTDIYKVDHWKELGLSKEEVNALIQDAIQTAGAIYNLDPKGRADWYNQQLDQIDSWQKDIFAQIGQDAINATNALLASVQPAIDWFKSLPDQDHLGGAFDNVTTSANAAAAALWGVAGGQKNNKSGAAAASEAASTSASKSGGGSHVVITVDDPNSFVQSVRQQRLAR